MDGGAWWAAVYGVTQSWTRLKRLSSSSNHLCLVTRQHKIYVSFTACQVILVINYIDVKVSVGGDKLGE